MHNRALLAAAISACSHAAHPQPEHEQASQRTQDPDEIRYRATGTEPFWGMSVSGRELKLTWPEPEPSVSEPYTVEERTQGRTYTGKSVRATVSYQTCSDGMSDRVYPHRVTLELGARVLSGCGWPAGHDLGPAP